MGSTTLGIWNNARINYHDITCYNHLGILQLTSVITVVGIVCHENFCITIVIFQCYNWHEMKVVYKQNMLTCKGWYRHMKKKDLHSLIPRLLMMWKERQYSWHLNNSKHPFRNSTTILIHITDKHPYRNYLHGPLSRYVELRVAHAPGMLGTFSLPLTLKEAASLRSRHACRDR